MNRKRKRETEPQLMGGGEVEVDDEHMRLNDADRDTLWRVNHDEFNRRFRHQLCVELVRDKVEPAAGAVLAAMLRVSREHELNAVEERSVPVSDAEVKVRPRVCLCSAFRAGGVLVEVGRLVVVTTHLNSASHKTGV